MKSKIPVPVTRKRTATTPATQRAISAPVAKSILYQTVRSKPMVISNSEFVLNVTFNTADVTSYLVPLAPYGFQWLKGVAQNFSTYRFTKLKVTYMPTCSTTTEGNVVIAAGFDFTDFYPMTQGGIKTSGFNTSIGTDSGLASFNPAVMGPAWQTTSIEIPSHQLLGDKKVIYSDSDWLPADTSAVAANMRNSFAPGYIQATVYTDVNPTQAGKIFVEYEIELYNPIPFAFNS